MSQLQHRMPMRRPPMCALALACSASLAAAPTPPPPLPESHCPAVLLVDAEFRDAALRQLDRLVVNAPGKSAHGAVFSHHSAGHVDVQGRAWHQVSAYQVNLGLIGALHVSPRALPLVAGWLQWQMRHIAPIGAVRGVVLDHWVREGDLEESTCPPGMAKKLCGHVDAYDSTAASTLLMADAYLRHGGDVMLLRQPAMRQALEAAATALRELAVDEGLTLAKPDYRIVYTMDVVEVAASWRAWARVQRNAYAEPQSAMNSQATAELAEARLRTRLWNAKVGAWRVGLDASALQPERWYPDTVAQAWPLLWGTERAGAAAARATWSRAVAPWQIAKRHWADTTVDPDGFMWPAAAVAAACTGDVASARRWVARARQRWLQPGQVFAWPFQVGDLLWLMWLAEPLQPPRPVSAIPDLNAATVAVCSLDPSLRPTRKML